MKSLHEAMLDPELFGKTFAGPTFANWRTVAKLEDGLPLEPSEVDFARTVTGRKDLVAQAVGKAITEAYFVFNRRSGKTLYAGARGLHTALQDYRDRLGPGEVATVALIASDRRQARQLMNYVKGLIEDSPLIAAEVTNQTRDTITFAHRVNLEVHTTSFRSTRGYSYAAVILDELAYFRDDLSANPDVELIRAVRPGLLNLNGRLLGFSSPHSKRGHLYDMHRKHFGKLSEVLVVQAGGLLLNPTLNQEALDRQREQDPLAARSEQDALFRDELRQFLDDLSIDVAIQHGTLSRPRRPDYEYVAYCDTSGGRKDSMCIAIAHQELGGRVALDKLHVMRAPLDPFEAVQRCTEVLGAYGLTTVMGDDYAADVFPSMFRQHGIAYQISPEDKSTIFNSVLPLFMAKRVEILDAPILVTELRLLEARPRPNGKPDLVDHPPNGHDDAAVAACGALWRASRLQWAGRSTAALLDTRLLRGDGLSYDPWDRGLGTPRSAQ